MNKVVELCELMLLEVVCVCNVVLLDLFDILSWGDLWVDIEVKIGEFVWLVVDNVL